jgi:hypothetical protein
MDIEVYDSKSYTVSSEPHESRTHISCLCLAGVDTGADPTT